jgi:hypothetical protein
VNIRAVIRDIDRAEHNHEHAPTNRGRHQRGRYTLRAKHFIEYQEDIHTILTLEPEIDIPRVGSCIGCPGE